MRGSGASVAIVVAGGDPIAAAVADRLPASGVVVAADSGLEHAVALGLEVDVVVGDFDSVDPAALEAARAAGATVETHPPEKDATDLELALDAAVARGARRVTVVGGYGGRVDHLLANVALLSSPRFTEVVIDAWMGSARILVVRDEVQLSGPIGSLCTLLAMHGPARGVTTAGLRYPLDGDTLLPGSTRGVSNELVVPVAHVSITDGTLVAIQPHALEQEE